MLPRLKRMGLLVAIAILITLNITFLFKFVLVWTLESDWENFERESHLMYRSLMSCEENGYFMIRESLFMCMYMGEYEQQDRGSVRGPKTRKWQIFTSGGQE